MFFLLFDVYLFVIIVRFILCFVRNEIFDVFWAFGACFLFLYFGVDWKGRVPALTERGLFGFGFCVPWDIAPEKGHVLAVMDRGLF